MSDTTLLVAKFEDRGVTVEGHCYMHHHFDERFLIVDKNAEGFLVRRIKSN